MGGGIGSSTRYHNKHCGIEARARQVILASHQPNISVKDCYSLLSGEDAVMQGGWSEIWSLPVSPKFQLFIWKIHHEILPLNALLYHRLSPNFHSAICNWCNRREETIRHLFLECELASWCWDIVYQWWEIDVKRNLQGNFFVISLFCMLGKGALNTAWKVTIVAILWTIWLLRNERVFSGKSTSKACISLLVKTRSPKWQSSLNLICKIFEHVWSIAPKECIMVSSH